MAIPEYLEARERDGFILSSRIAKTCLSTMHELAERRSFGLAEDGRSPFSELERVLDELVDAMLRDKKTAVRISMNIDVKVDDVGQG